MTIERHWIWRGTWLACGVLACFAIGVIAPSCGAAGLAAEIQKTGCAEFWFNRYQTFIASLIALAGAAATVWMMRRQAKLTQRQIDVALGDVEPEFILVPVRAWILAGGELPHLQITVNNWNRRKLMIERIASHDPRLIFFVYERAGDYSIGKRPVAGSEGGSEADVRVTVDRCDMTLRKPGHVSLHLMTVGDRGTPGATADIIFDVTYSLEGQAALTLPLSLTVTRASEQNS